MINRAFRRKDAHSEEKSVIPIHKPLIPEKNRSFRYTSGSFRVKIAHSEVKAAYSARKSLIP